MVRNTSRIGDFGRFGWSDVETDKRIEFLDPNYLLGDIFKPKYPAKYIKPWRGDAGHRTDPNEIDPENKQT